MDTYMTTYSGVKFSLENPRPEDVRLWDIGWALSRIPRFGGHTQDTWTVAEHSLYVVEIMKARGIKDLRTLLEGLLHDAHEAYIGDIVFPVAEALDIRALKMLKVRLDRVIYAKFLSPRHGVPDLRIKQADDIALRMEAEYFMVHPEAIALCQQVDTKGAPPPVHSILGGRTDFVRGVLDLRQRILEGPEDV